MKTCTLLFAFLATACATIDPKDVEADRARWTAFRDVTADGTVSPAEAPLVSALLVEWDKKLAADEAAAGKARDAKSILADLLRVYGVATVQVFVAQDLQARAPELFRFVDANSDGTLSADELLSIDPANPVFALVVATTAQRLLSK